MIPLAVICGVGPVPDETFIRRDLEALRRHGWNVRVFGLNEGRGFFPSRRLMRPLWRKAIGMASRPRQALAFLRRSSLVSDAARFAGENGVILAEFAWLTADVASAAASVHGRPWGCFVHAWDVFTRPSREISARLRGARCVFACSGAARDAVRAAGVPPGIVHLVHHGLPLDKLEECLLPKKRHSVCAVGRLEVKKGFDLLLRAWPMVREKVPDATLRLIGDGGERDALARLLPPAGGSASILPAMEERGVWREMAAAELFVLPSRRLPSGDRDGIANVLLEAMAQGTPVITTDAGAAGEIIRPGETGALLDAKAITPATLAEEIVRSLLAPGVAAAMAGKGREVIGREFDLATTSRQLHEFLSSLDS